MNWLTHREWTRHLQEIGMLSPDHQSCPFADTCKAQEEDDEA